MKQLITIIFLFFWVNIYSQEIKKTQDIGLWTGASLEYEFSKDYVLKFSQELRLFEDISEVEEYITDLGLEYKINKNFKLGVNLRYYLNKKKDKTISQDWRYNFDLKFKKKIIHGLKFKYRLRYQTAYKNLFAVVSEGMESNFRNQISFNYKLNKKNDIYLGTELFRKIIDYRKPYFNKIRFLIGDEMETKVGGFDFSIGYERELNSNYPLNYFFGRIYYKIELKREK